MMYSIISAHIFKINFDSKTTLEMEDVAATNVGVYTEPLGHSIALRGTREWNNACMVASARRERNAVRLVDFTGQVRQNPAFPCKLLNFATLLSTESVSAEVPNSFMENSSQSQCGGSPLHSSLEPFPLDSDEEESKEDEENHNSQITPKSTSSKAGEDAESLKLKNVTLPASQSTSSSYGSIPPSQKYLKKRNVPRQMFDIDDEDEESEKDSPKQIDSSPSEPRESNIPIELLDTDDDAEYSEDARLNPIQKSQTSGSPKKAKNANSHPSSQHSNPVSLNTSLVASPKSALKKTTFKRSPLLDVSDSEEQISTSNSPPAHQPTSINDISVLSYSDMLLTQAPLPCDLDDLFQSQEKEDSYPASQSHLQQHDHALPPALTDSSPFRNSVGIGYGDPTLLELSGAEEESFEKEMEESSEGGALDAPLTGKRVRFEDEMEEEHDLEHEDDTMARGEENNLSPTSNGRDAEPRNENQLYNNTVDDHGDYELDPPSYRTKRPRLEEEEEQEDSNVEQRPSRHIERYSNPHLEDDSQEIDRERHFRDRSYQDEKRRKRRKEDGEEETRYSEEEERYESRHRRYLSMPERKVSFSRQDPRDRGNVRGSSLRNDHSSPDDSEGDSPRPNRAHSPQRASDRRYEDSQPAYERRLSAGWPSVPSPRFRRTYSVSSRVNFKDLTSLLLRNDESSSRKATDR